MRYLVLPALLLMTLNLAFGQEGIPLKIIRQVSRSVFPIACGYPNTSGGIEIVGIAGTGFFIDNHGRFMTDAHVLNGLPSFMKVHTCFPIFYIPNEAWGGFEYKVDFQWFTFSHCYSNLKMDLAICQPVENPFTSKRLKKGSVTVVSLERQEAMEGTPVAFTGFPLQRVTPITSEGHVAGFVPIDGDPNEFDYFVDKTAWPGASGSPLYLANGKVIGIVRATGQKESYGISMARSSIAITKFIANHPYKPPGEN